MVSRFKQLLTTAWTKNGDSLSLFYSGTRALSFDGKANKVGGVNDIAVTSSSRPSAMYCMTSLIPPTQFKGGARSVQRTILNNFMDSNKQEAIDMLLLSNAYSGDLGQKSRALLDQSDVFSELFTELLKCNNGYLFHSQVRFHSKQLCVRDGKTLPALRSYGLP